MRDAYFSYASGGAGCGWHVDDEGFWPAENDTTGVTVWIALDDMDVATGGGLAVANQTHRPEGTAASWVQECRAAIRGSGTCNMERAHPECQKRLEEQKFQWDMKAADAIFLDRRAFHRTVSAAPNEKERYTIGFVTITCIPALIH